MLFKSTCQFDRRIDGLFAELNFEAQMKGVWHVCLTVRTQGRTSLGPSHLHISPCIKKTYQPLKSKRTYQPSDRCISQSELQLLGVGNIAATCEATVVVDTCVIFIRVYVYTFILVRGEMEDQVTSMCKKNI